MSAQSIYLKTRERLADDLDRDLTHQAKDFLLKKRFMLGNGVNRKKRNHALMALDFICTENCDLIAHINAELKGCQIGDEKDSMVKDICSLPCSDWKNSNW